MNDAGWLFQHTCPTHGWYLTGPQPSSFKKDGCGCAYILDPPPRLVRLDPDVPLGKGANVYGGPRREENGLFATRQLINGMGHFWGLNIWRVRVTGRVMESAQELCATERLVLWGIDGSDIILDFARRCAARAAEVMALPVNPIVARFLREGLDIHDCYRAMDQIHPIVCKLLPNAPLVNPQGGPLFDVCGDGQQFSDPTTLCYFAIYSALQAAILGKPERRDREDEYCAVRWSWAAVVMRLKMLAWIRANALGMAIKPAYVHEFDIANRELEAEVWKAAYAHGLTTPGAEKG
jgi:hypothetical protein